MGHFSARVRLQQLQTRRRSVCAACLRSLPAVSPVYLRFWSPTSTSKVTRAVCVFLQGGNPINVGSMPCLRFAATNYTRVSNEEV